MASVDGRLRDAAGIDSTYVFADDKVRLRIGRGAIHRTVDGGAHWVMIKTPGVYQPG